jgi:hypothetical protein
MTHLPLHETPKLGVHQTGSSSTISDAEGLAFSHGEALVTIQAYAAAPSDYHPQRNNKTLEHGKCIALKRLCLAHR